MCRSDHSLSTMLTWQADFLCSPVFINFLLSPSFPSYLFDQLFIQCTHTSLLPFAFLYCGFNLFQVKNFLAGFWSLAINCLCFVGPLFTHNKRSEHWLIVNYKLTSKFSLPDHIIFICLKHSSKNYTTVTASFVTCCMLSYFECIETLIH